MKTVPYSLIILIGVAIVLSYSVSCRQKQQVVKPSAEVSGKMNLYTKPPSGLTDTLRISQPAAVFFRANPNQLKKVQALIQVSAFESMNHECFYQMRNAKNVLRQYYPKVNIIETTKERWLLFENEGHINTCIDLDKVNDICGIFLFDSQQKPVLIDMMNIDTQAGFYYNDK